MMRNLLGIALAGFLALAVAGNAGAATINYSGTLTFGIADLPPASATGSGIYVGPSHILTISFSPGRVGPITTSLPVTSSFTVNSVILTGVANLTGVMTGLSGGPPGGGPMGLSGVAKICLVFAPCAFASVTVPLTPAAGVGFGIGGTQVVPAAVALTMVHAPWTVGQPFMTLHSPGSSYFTVTGMPGGFAHGPASLTSSTAQNSGVLQLVTATKVYSSLTAAFPELPVFSIVNLHFFGTTTTSTSTTTTVSTTSTTTTLPPKEKVTICHKGKAIAVAPPAVTAHLRHGDILAPPDPSGPYGCSYYGASIYPPQERGISLAASGLATVLILAGVLGSRRRH